jgi:Galactose-3-O-sulfotransferase
MLTPTQPQFTIFLHIQKTGGITLQRILRRKLGRSLPHRALQLVKPAPQPTTLEAALQSKQMGDRYFAGHVCFGVHRQLPQPFTYITMLREPVARVLSLYQYSRANTTAYYHKHAVDQSLEEFVLHSPLMELDNGQTRFLAGDTHDYFINRTPVGQCNQDLLDLAKHNIDTYFSWVGLMEYFDPSLLLLGKKMGWNHCLYLRRNTGKEKHRDKVSDTLRNAIAERNSLDIEIYEYAKQRLLQELQQHSLDNPQHIQSFQTQNRTFNHYLNLPYNAYDSLKATFRGQIGRPS